jgi:hypothetical protein
MAYSKAKLKSSGDRASPCFRPFWIGNLSDKCLPIRTLLYVSFKHILINLDPLCGLVVRVPENRVRFPTLPDFLGKKKKGRQVVGLERGPLSLVSTTKEIHDRKIAAPV